MAGLLASKPQQHLPRASEFLQFGKDQLDRLLDTPIRIFLNLPSGSPAIANREHELQVPALCFLTYRFLTALPEQVEFELAHRAFEPQQESVIEQPRIIDAVGIYNQCSHQPTQFDQVMPVTTVAGQARSLDTEDCTHVSIAYLGNQSGKTRAIYLSGTRSPQVFVDHLDLLEAKLTSLVSQRVLAPLTLEVIGDLNGG